MSDTSNDTVPGIEPRPIGFVEPEHERAGLALAAIESDCLTDAAKHIATVPDSSIPDRAWKLLMRGLLAAKRADSAEAEGLLLQAFSWAFVAGRKREGTSDPQMLRLGARALNQVGRLYRRRDCPKEAYEVHLAAYDLRERCGSLSELWETTVDLALDADVARSYEDARRWCNAAIGVGGQARDEPARKQAIAWTHLSTSLAGDDRHDEAVAAARTARDSWRKHDIGAVSAAQADVKLGSALLKQGELLHERGDPQARRVLDEAIECLAAAHEALLAFGPDHAADAQLCLEQKDFAERLVASLTM